MSRYGFGLGYPPFREAVAAFMQRRFGHRFDPVTETLPLIGSKEGLSHLALAYAGEGDTTIIPDPGYNAYRGGTQLAGAEPYMYAITPRTDFLIDLDEVPADVLKRAKILYLNYPNNPTGAVAPKAYLERVVRRCRELDILLVYDNAYSEMTFDGYVAPSIFDIDGARDVALEFHSFSKTFNMTGWRCAFAVGDAKLIAPLVKVKSFTDTGQFMPIQRAAVAALETSASWLPGNLDVFRERRDAAVRAFADAGFTTVSPRATMYLWIPLLTVCQAQRLRTRSWKPELWCFRAPDWAQAARAFSASRSSRARRESRKQPSGRGRCWTRCGSAPKCLAGELCDVR